MKNIMFYLTLNYPNKKEFFNILDSLKENNFGYLEIGIPVTDPYMDGDIIKRTHEEVLAKNLLREDVVDTLEKIKNEYDFKVILMTYFEGVEKFQLDELKPELYDGLLCVDKYLTTKEIKKPVQLYAPQIENTERMEKMENNETLAYVVSGEGKTGSFDEVPSEYIRNLNYLKKNTDIPIFVGFGIKSKKDVDQVLESGADGAIIGTSFLKTYIEEGMDGLNRYVKSFSE